jgi:hypothetical protein
MVRFESSSTILKQNAKTSNREVYISTNIEIAGQDYAGQLLMFPRNVSLIVFFQNNQSTILTEIF